MEAEIADSIAPLRLELERLQEEALFSGEYDAGDAVVTLQSDVGGTDAQDFTEMLLRMYERWADDRGFKTEIVEASPGEEAGLKSATFTVEGEKLTGQAVAERMGEKSTVTLTGGTVKGDQIAFTEPMKFQGQDVPITYTGTVAGDGDEIKFTRKVGDFATEELVAKRKKD